MCLDYGLSLPLVLAMCKVESNFNPKAIRYEPNWQYPFSVSLLSSKTGVTYETERILQACSFGMLQCMGAVARELGFDRPLVEMLLPEVGLEYGCMKLRKLKGDYDDINDIISAYNQGSPLKVNGKYRNQIYVDKVRKAMNEFSNQTF